MPNCLNGSCLNQFQGQTSRTIVKTASEVSCSENAKNKYLTLCRSVLKSGIIQGEDSAIPPGWIKLRTGEIG